MWWLITFIFNAWRWWWTTFQVVVALNASPEYNTDPEIVVEPKYYDPDELKNMKIPNKDKSLALFNINACFLNKHLMT